ncbi:glycoside hydrolase [Bacteroides sp.]
MKHLIWILCLNLFLYTTLSYAGNLPTQIILYPQQKEQVIDGFGIAQAGWADKLYEHHKRTEVMDLLFGKDGLCLSILRGEIFPQSPTDTIDKSLKTKAQLWVSHYAQDICNVDKLIYSAWTPPAHMKSNGKDSHGFLKPEYYQAYADYLVNFCKAYQENGLHIYAISPSNEPGYEAPWNSCKWTPGQMGQFLSENLAPVMKEHCPAIKIIYGENPTWSTPQNPMLQFISSDKFVNEILDTYPDVTGDMFIASGHGYDIPVSEYFKDLKDIATPIIRYTKAIERGQNVWVTEISSTDPLDAGMANGLKWAATYHDYLTKANINGFVWWGGAIPTSNNESLIVLGKNGEDYSLTKRYDTFGNYTRYIPVGSHRIRTEQVSLPDTVRVSSFCKGNQHSTVAINPTNKTITCRLAIKGCKVTGNLQAYTTTAKKKWEENIIKPNKSYYTVTLLPESVTTLVGSIN